MREHVFNNKNDRLWLENLLHPKIYQESKNQIKLVKENWCLWVVPLLIEKNLQHTPNRILLVDTTIKNQIKRVMKRDKISLQSAKKIIALQASRTARIAISDDIIFNKRNIDQIRKYVDYFNLFYSYLSEKNNQKKTINIKKNYLTRFY